MTILALGLNPVMNDGTRKGGFAPSQWVLGKFPRQPGNMFDESEFADLGALTNLVTPDHQFARTTAIRQDCKRAFAQEDCSTRVQRALLRKAAPLRGEYTVGDLIEFKKEQGARTEHDMEYSMPNNRI